MADPPDSLKKTEQKPKQPEKPGSREVASKTVTGQRLFDAAHSRGAEAEESGRKPETADKPETKDAEKKSPPSQPEPSLELRMEIAARLLHRVSSAKIEDQLQESLKKPGLNLALRSKLIESINDDKPLDAALRLSLETELKAGHLRADLASDLQKLVTGTLSKSDKMKLADEVNKGVFNRPFLQTVMANEGWKGLFNPASAAGSTWRNLVSAQESRLSDNAASLIDAKYASIPPGAPFTHSQYEDFKKNYERFKKENETSESTKEKPPTELIAPELKLGIAADRPPRERDVVNYLNAISWNEQTEQRLQSNNNIAIQEELHGLTKKFQREGWWPAEGPDRDPVGFIRRMEELRGILPVAEMAKATLQGLKALTDLREDKDGTSPVNKAIEVGRPVVDLLGNAVSFRNPLSPLKEIKDAVTSQPFAHNQWMLEAIKSYPGDIASGMPDIPTDLNNSLANEAKRKAITDWLETYRDRTKKVFDDFWGKVLTNQILVYGDRDRSAAAKDSELSPTKNKPYSLIRSDFQVIQVRETTDGQGGKKFDVTQETRYSSPSILLGNAYDLDPLRWSDVESTKTPYRDIKSGTLMPVITGGKLYAVEVDRLKAVRGIDATKYTGEKAFSAGIDALWLLTEVGPLTKGLQAAQVATVAAKGGVKTFTGNALRTAGSHALGTGLALAGALNTAETRQYEWGRAGLGLRSAAIVGLAGWHLAEKAPGLNAGLSSAIAPDAGILEAGGDGMLSMSYADRSLQPLLDTTIAEQTSALERQLAARFTGTAAEEQRIILEGMERSRAEHAKQFENLVVRTENRHATSGRQLEGASGRTVSSGNITEQTGLEASRSAGVEPSSSAVAKKPLEAGRLKPVWDFVEGLSQKTMENSQVVIAGMLGTSILKKTVARPDDSLASKSINDVGKEALSISELMSKNRELVFSAARAGFSYSADPETAQRLQDLFTKGEAAAQLPADAPVRQAKIAELEARLQSGSRTEKAAASLALLQLAWQQDGSVAEKVGSQEVNNLLESLKGEVARAEQLDSKAKEKGNEDHLSPDASLVVAHTLLSFSQATGQQFISGQQYALEAARVANSPTASPETKMKAISSLGLSAYSANLTEQRINTVQAAAQYWRLSNSSTRADLEKTLSAIATGRSGEQSPDLRAFAASMLHTVRQQNQTDQAEMFDKTLNAWQNDYNPKLPGQYASSFIAKMREEMAAQSSDGQAASTSAEDSNQKHSTQPKTVQTPEESRAKQYLAALTLLDLKSDLKNPQEALKALAAAVDPLAPEVALKAVEALLPHLDELEKRDKTRVYTGTSMLLELQANDAKTPIDPIKQQLLPLLPRLLAKCTEDGAQLTNMVSDLTALVDPRVDNMYYAANPDLRLNVIETMQKLRSTAAESVLVDVLKHKDGKPIEPSADVRLAALTTLKILHAAALSKVAADLDRIEVDPRIKQELATILKSSGATCSGQSAGDATAAIDSGSIDSKTAYDFLKKQFKDMLKEIYDDGIQELGGYDALGFFRKEPGYDRYQQDHEAEVHKLERWATGQFLPGEVQVASRQSSEQAQLKVQKEAVRAMAFLIASEKPLLPDFDREEAIDSYARSLKTLATRPGPVQPEAFEYAIELLKSESVSVSSKLSLIDVLRDYRRTQLSSAQSAALGQEHLRSGADLHKLEDSPQLSKELAAARTIEVLSRYRAGKLIEDRPLPSEEKAATKQKSEAASSRMLQEELIRDIVYRYQDNSKESMALIEGISRNSKDAELRESAKRYLLSMQGGVEVAFEAAKAQPDRVTPLAERAEKMAAALLLPATEKASAVRTLFEGSSGMPIDDAGRLSVLTRALQHSNESIRLTGAFCLVGNGTGEHNRVAALQQLAHLASNANDPAVKYEAGRKIEQIQKQANNSIRTSRDDREGLSAATALTYLSSRGGERKSGIESLIRLEANAGSSIVKKEAGLVLDRIIADLKEHNKANATPQLKHTIDIIQTGRQRALGLPVLLEAN